MVRPFSVFKKVKKGEQLLIIHNVFSFVNTDRLGVIMVHPLPEISLYPMLRYYMTIALELY